MGFQKPTQWATIIKQEHTAMGHCVWVNPMVEIVTWLTMVNQRHCQHIFVFFHMGDDCAMKLVSFQQTWLFKTIKDGEDLGG